MNESNIFMKSKGCDLYNLKCSCNSLQKKHSKDTPLTCTQFNNFVSYFLCVPVDYILNMLTLWIFYLDF